VTNKERASSATTDPLVVNTWIRQVSTVTTLSAFPATDPRGAKAVAIAADAGQWAKVTTRDGRKFYGIRSADGSHYYLVNRHSCTCQGFAFANECKHRLAVELHCEMIAEQTNAAKYDDVFKRFDYDEDRALTRILGRPLPKTERED